METDGGGGEFRICTQLIVPRSRPLLATLGILTILWNWNSFVGPLIFIPSESKLTLPLDSPSCKDVTPASKTSKWPAPP